MTPCCQCGKPVPVYHSKHPDLRHITADDFCKRECAEDFFGVERREHAGLGMHGFQK